MPDLSTCHKQARRLVISLRQGLEHLEKLEQQGRDVSTLATSLMNRLKDLERISLDMDGMWRMHLLGSTTQASTRDIWKRKVQLVAEDVDSIKTSLHRHGIREQRRQRDAEDRKELFARSQEGTQVARQMDEESQMMKSIQSSKKVLGEAFTTGTSILENMAKNRDVLKGAQRRALDMINTIGLSESLLRVIERRQRGDILLTYGGMIALIVVLMLLWWFLA